MLGFGEFAVDAGDFGDLAGVDFVALIAEALTHLAVEIDRVDELHLAFASALLAVGDDPDISADAGVVEELIGEGDDGFQPIVFDDPAADFAFAGAGIAGSFSTIQRRISLSPEPASPVKRGEPLNT